MPGWSYEKYCTSQPRNSPSGASCIYVAHLLLISGRTLLPPFASAICNASSAEILSCARSIECHGVDTGLNSYSVHQIELVDGSISIVCTRAESCPPESTGLKNSKLACWGPISTSLQSIRKSIKCNFQSVVGSFQKYSWKAAAIRKIISLTPLYGLCRDWRCWCCIEEDKKTSVA